MFDRAPEINPKSGQHCGQAIPDAAAGGLLAAIQPVKVSAVAPLVQRRHPAKQLRQAPFDLVSQMGARRQRAMCQGTESASEDSGVCVLTPRSSGRAHHKVPSPYAGARAAQLNR